MATTRAGPALPPRIFSGKQASLNPDAGSAPRFTSRSICDAVGERLQQSLRPEPRLPTQLEQLLAELKKRDRDKGPR